MEKTMLVINSHQIDAPAVDFACYMCQLIHSKLSGLFIDDVLFQLEPSDKYQQSYFNEVPENEATQEAIKTDTGQSIRYFKETCEKKGVACDVYEDIGNPIDEVVYESRFIDVLIVDSRTSFSDREESIPTHFVKKVLANAACPVIITPYEFEGVDEIVFCYNGSLSAIFALKQFTYLLPEYKTKKVTVLEVRDNTTKTLDKDGQKVYEWLKAHYETVSFHFLDGSVDDEFLTYFLRKEKAFVVMGAYGRSMLSNFFKRSSAEEMIQYMNLPLFITHH